MAILKQDFHTAAGNQADITSKYRDRSGTKVVKIILQTGNEAKNVWFEVVNKYGDVIDTIASWTADTAQLFKHDTLVELGGGEEIHIRTTAATAEMMGYVYNEEPKL